jgi:apolipoprotein N-acyltransferase
VGLLLVPAREFTFDGWLHARMAVFPGVESGFTIARARQHGILTVRDNRGVLAEQNTAREERVAS